jgi:hypothetical protein
MNKNGFVNVRNNMVDEAMYGATMKIVETNFRGAGIN